METILWFTMFLSNFIATLLTIYFYLLHEDFKNEKITAFNLTSILTKYIPIEIIFQLFVAILSAIHRSYYLFACLIPLTVFNVHTLIKRNHLIYGFTPSEYRYQSQKLQAQMKYKSLVYTVLCFQIGLKFTLAFSRMALYRLDLIIESIMSS